MSRVPAACLLGSSIRSRPVETTLLAAAEYAAARDITRVTDITRLDRIGIPVCVSVRPGAANGSLCVHAGKGLTPAEARASALMEAVEFAAAEPGASSVPLIPATVRDVLDGRSRPRAVLDFCPVLQASISLDAPMACVEAVDLLTGAATLVPAESVFYPIPPADRSYFGTTTNGIASGNSVLDATLHGLCEALERDVTSFHIVRDSSELVLPESFPDVGKELHARIVDAGLSMFVRFQPNEFSLPAFSATIADRSHPGAINVHGGYGCHLRSSIALVRAITEAAQSRLTFIHGGRDDLILEHGLVESKTPEEIAERSESLISRRSATDRIVEFDDVPDHSEAARDLESCLGLLSEILVNRGFRWILRVPLTHPDDPVQVVRTIVPGLEHFAKHVTRVGPRLAAFVNSL